jgi:prolyl oligopeptidase PreP (S9A serine peptidase family)
MAMYAPFSKLHMAVRMQTYYQSEQFWLDEHSGEWRQYDVPSDATIAQWNTWLSVALRSGWTVGDTAYAAGSLLVIDRDAFLSGARGFTVLFAPDHRQALTDVTCLKHSIAISFSDDGTTHIVLWQPPATRTPIGGSASLRYLPPVKSPLPLSTANATTRVLFVTSSCDDRVHPGHARKMTARMQALGRHRVWVLEQKDGGHGGGVTPETIAKTQAIMREFLWSILAEGNHHDCG